jgi:hypothetical protein
MLQLDKMITGKRSWWIDHWIEDFVKTGVSWDEILATMKAWLDERQSFEALQVVAEAVSIQGRRRDVGGLTIYEGMPQLVAAQLIKDTEFAVRRRSIR